MPKIDRLEWTNHPGKTNPLFGESTGPYGEIVVGDAMDLQQFGVRLECLRPGSRSSQRHWHEAEDEFVFVVSGELVLVEDDETNLSSGDAAGWRAGAPVAHCLENRSSADATILVVGTRQSADKVHYPDHDMILHRDGDDYQVTKLDGSPKWS
ncbi:cupin domain-containing protein [Pyruvatibacter sp.]|uniref:cupin domain-containing protein n=1 Tax=Pyruvatibacter sp. TaxID=1981328 RepID=UPI003262E805